MVDVAKREDRLLDYISEMKSRIDMALMQVEFYKSKGLTSHEIEILNSIEKLLKTPEKAADGEYAGV